jgi:hypothetical protein
MSNYLVSYDLNGPTPSHKQVDDLLGQLGATRGRVLETVWYVGYAGSRQSLFEAIDRLLGLEDRLLVVDAPAATWRNLLVTDESLQQSWLVNA